MFNHLAFGQVLPQDLETVLYIDCSKMGVISQLEVNMVGELANKVIFRNPIRTWSLLQDNFGLDFLFGLKMCFY